MKNLQVLVRCYDKVAQNSGFRCPPLTSPLGYTQTFRAHPKQVRSTPDSGSGRHPRRWSQVDPKEKLSLVDVAEFGCEYSERPVD